ncbi:MAG TPA: hypothetical protein VJJ23_01450 [Candidatus Nanoarchaeia archaeon]|nr:hypothetical protein [Candidatus Nanoarchaeia archaeon]
MLYENLYGDREKHDSDSAWGIGGSSLEDVCCFPLSKPNEKPMLPLEKSRKTKLVITNIPGRTDDPRNTGGQAREYLRDLYTDNECPLPKGFHNLPAVECIGMLNRLMEEHRLDGLTIERILAGQGRRVD